MLLKDYKNIFDINEESVVVHGDPAHYNSLTNNDRTYLIDPGPVRFATREWEVAYFQRRYWESDNRERKALLDSFTKSYLDEYGEELDGKKLAFFRIQTALGKLAWSVEKNIGVEGSLNQLDSVWKSYTREQTN